MFKQRPHGAMILAKLAGHMFVSLLSPPITVLEERWISKRIASLKLLAFGVPSLFASSATSGGSHKKVASLKQGDYFGALAWVFEAWQALMWPHLNLPGFVFERALPGLGRNNRLAEVLREHISAPRDQMFRQLSSGNLTHPFKSSVRVFFISTGPTLVRYFNTFIFCYGEMCSHQPKIRLFCKVSKIDAGS